MLLLEQELDVPTGSDERSLLEELRESVNRHLPAGLIPIRFVITSCDDGTYRCEVGSISGLQDTDRSVPASIFDYAPRADENADRFNVALLVPTGIGAEIGGHAGDAAPVARLLANVCDTLVTHPNVVNASDINEIADNALYVEGSVLCRLLMGTIALRPVPSNRVLVVIDDHDDEFFTNAAVNSVNAARATYGLRCAGVVKLSPPVILRARYASSGSATGRVEALDGLLAVLDEHRKEFDAVAISSMIDVPQDYHMKYFVSAGKMVNPWGGVEAMLTHAISGLYNVPSAHAPMLETREIANMDPGVVDPRMAAEAVSTTFIQCTLKGLHRSPRIVSDRTAFHRPGVLSAADVSCLVIPDGCLGLPTLAALQQGIPVIAVRENRNVMRNDLTALPWGANQLHIVENYWEAVGVLAAMKAGIAPESVRRPLHPVNVDLRTIRSAHPSVADAETQQRTEISGKLLA